MQQQPLLLGAPRPASANAALNHSPRTGRAAADPAGSSAETSVRPARHEHDAEHPAAHLRRAADEDAAVTDGVAVRHRPASGDRPARYAPPRATQGRPPTSAADRQAPATRNPDTRSTRGANRSRRVSHAPQTTGPVQPASSRISGTANARKCARCWRSRRSPRARGDSGSWRSASSRRMLNSRPIRRDAVAQRSAPPPITAASTSSRSHCRGALSVPMTRGAAASPAGSLHVALRPTLPSPPA